MPFAWPYDCRRASLLHPGDARDFFARGTPPSEPALAAELVRLVYCRDSTVVNQTLAKAGITLVDCQLEGTGTQWLLVREPGRRAFLAFRGTEADDPTDIGTNLAFLPATWGAGGRVDGGFAAALEQVWARLSLALDKVPEGRIIYTGHSLGGALTVLACSRRKPTRAYTFGAPRVGDAEFAGGQSGVDHVRFVLCCDLVPRLPPLCKHTGRQMYLDRDGNLRLDANEGTITADQQRASGDYILQQAWRPGTAPVRELADHIVGNYASAVWGSGTALAEDVSGAGG
ncbi:MAG: lipase family protein [Acetobacteraceae bacterium]|nr:lipase family protein [Acetobacteraceae bacterium]